MAMITATVTPGTTPPSVTIVTTWDGGFAPNMGPVERVQDGVSTPVRGTEGLVTWVDLTILDYECPQETPVTYTFAGATSPAVEMPDVGVWLIPAGRPELAAQLVVQTYPSWARPVQAWGVDIPGRPNPVVVSSTKRSSRRGSIDVIIRENLTDYATLDACLEVTGPMLLSSPARHHPLEVRALWVVIGDVDEESFGPSSAMWWVFTLPLIRVDRPEVVAVEARHRWVDQVGRWSAQVGTWAQQ